jgi:hypothetical protein
MYGEHQKRRKNEYQAFRKFIGYTSKNKVTYIFIPVLIGQRTVQQDSLDSSGYYLSICSRFVRRYSSILLVHINSPYKFPYPIRIAGAQIQKGIRNVWLFRAHKTDGQKRTNNAMELTY